MPVADHLDMLSAQFLASALRPSHPSNAVVTAPPGPRDMKKTLQAKHLARVAPFLTNGATDPNTYNNLVKKLHTVCVDESLKKLGNYHLLDGPSPPKISSTETTLSRQERTTLRQIRTGYCKRLNDYKHSFMTPPRAPDALCPECLIRRHTSRHLFECDARPTDLIFKDLFDHPARVIAFLKTLPSFTFLNPPDPPPPPLPPPPDPPP